MKVVSASSCIVFFILFSLSTPKAFASTTFHISNNGAGSNNTVTVNNSSNNNIFQSNNGFISNFIKIFTNTGGNEANGNTGGNTTVTSGDATSNVTITNNLGGNNIVNTVPEFGMIPGVIALLSSGATFLYIKKRRFN